MRGLHARYDGVCYADGGVIVRGDLIGYDKPYRGMGRTYCTRCYAQYCRDLVADDFDLANNRSM